MVDHFSCLRISFKKLFFFFSAFTLGASLLTGIIFAPAAFATACGTGGTPALTFVSDPTFQINTGSADNANYIGYGITPSANVANLWVGVSGF